MLMILPVRVRFRMNVMIYMLLCYVMCVCDFLYERYVCLLFQHEVCMRVMLRCVCIYVLCVYVIFFACARCVCMCVRFTMYVMLVRYTICVRLCMYVCFCMYVRMCAILGYAVLGYVCNVCMIGMYLVDFVVLFLYVMYVHCLCMCV